MSGDFVVFLLQENLIHDDNKLILLASLSDSLEYVADSIERWVFYMLFNLDNVLIVYKASIYAMLSVWQFRF